MGKRDGEEGKGQGQGKQGEWTGKRESHGKREVGWGTGKSWVRA